MVLDHESPEALCLRTSHALDLDGVDVTHRGIRIDVQVQVDGSLKQGVLSLREAHFPHRSRDETQEGKRRHRCIPLCSHRTNLFSHVPAWLSVDE